MNTFFAFYLWLLQILGAPTPVLANGTEVQQPANTYAAPAPPPGQTTVSGDRDLSFISNGF